jgi:hypothetical protein
LTRRPVTKLKKIFHLNVNEGDGKTFGVHQRCYPYLILKGAQAILSRGLKKGMTDAEMEAKVNENIRKLADGTLRMPGVKAEKSGEPREVKLLPRKGFFLSPEARCVPTSRIQVPSFFYCSPYILSVVSAPVCIYSDERPGLTRELPNWMFDESYCSGMTLGQPEISITGLNKLADVRPDWRPHVHKRLLLPDEVVIVRESCERVAG